MAYRPTLPVKTWRSSSPTPRPIPATVNFAATPGHRRDAGRARGSRQLSGADIAIIPYKGGAAALPDFLGGRIQMLNPTPSTTIPLIRDGRMRALAITSPARIADLPEVPTVREAGLPELTLEFWAGVLAPAGTPPEIVGKLNAAINETLRSAEMKESMASSASTPRSARRRISRKFIAEEMPRWADDREGDRM